jgi:hypothetical protein
MDVLLSRLAADSSAAAASRSSAASSSVSDSDARLAVDAGQLLSKAFVQFMDRALDHLQPFKTANRAASSSSSSNSCRTTDVAAVAVEHGALTLLISASSHSSAADVAAVIRENGESLTLLVGRALHVAATALLQLHGVEQAAARDTWGAEDGGQTAETAQEEVFCFSAVLYFYLAALGPLLEAAASSCAASTGAAASGSSSSSSSSAASPTDSSASTVSKVRELHKLQRQLQQGTWMNFAQSVHNASAADAEVRQYAVVDVQKNRWVEVFPVSAAQQMLQLASGVCTQLVSVEGAAQCCANPGCTNCSKLSERELVAGKSTVCSGCRAVRLCSAGCNTAYWKAGHRQVCKRLRGGKQQQKGGGERKSSSAGVAGSAAGAGRSTRSRKSSSSSSSGGGSALVAD